MRWHVLAALPVLGCALWPDPVLEMRHHGVSDRRCPDGGRGVIAKVPAGWRVWGTREDPSMPGMPEFVYSTPSGKRLSWCDYTQAVWEKQRAAIHRGAEPSREIFDEARQTLIERERAEVLADLRARFDARQHAAQQQANQRALAAESAVSRAPATELEQEPPAVDVALPRTLAEESERALGLLATRQGEDRIDAICTARGVLKMGDPSGELAGLAAAERRASKALMRELKQQEVSSLQVLCRDGEPSGCECGRNYRGCCSHHGGLAPGRPCIRVVEQPAVIECEGDDED